MENDNTQQKTGPKPKQIVEGIILGIKVGRDSIVIPPEQVFELAALGCTNSEISKFFGVDDSTLGYNFKRELEKGRSELKITLRRSMLKNATVNLNAAVQIFLAKNILGMSDTPVNTESNQPLPWIEGTAETIEPNATDNIQDIEVQDDIADTGGM